MAESSLITTAEDQHPAIPFYRVTGDAISRGRQIGELTRSRIEHSLNTYQQTFALCEISWAQAIERARQHADIIESVSPVSMEELQGMAAGAAVDLDSLLALNCRTEILPADFMTRAMAMPVNECTSMAMARNENPVWLAQNWDWFGRQRQAVCVVESTPDVGEPHITVTEAGMLAKIGLNSKGFGITLNILRSGNDGDRAGVPVHILLRQLLECESVAEAQALLSTCEFGSSSNIMVADAGGSIASFELSPTGVRTLEAKNHTLCHTNHFLDDELAAHDVGRPGNDSTINRLRTARQHMTSLGGFEHFRALLSDTSDSLESICRFPDTSLPEIAQIETVVGVIMDLTSRTLSVSAAQPSITEFTSYSLN